MPQLRIKSGLGRGKVFRLHADSVKIGRDPSCKVQVLESGVSREHAEVYRVGEMYFIRDLGSRNGTSVNDLKIEDELLRDGDLIQISNSIIVFEGSQSAPGTAKEEEAADESFYKEDFDPSKTLTLRVRTGAPAGPVSEKMNIALARLKKAAAEGSDLKAVMEECMDILSLGFETQEVFVFTMDAASRLHLRAHRLAKGAQKGKASKTIVQRALMEKRTILTANAKEDFRFRSEDSIMFKNVLSVLCCPLIAFGREMGVLYMSNGPESKAFTEENAEFADLVASQLSLMVAASDASGRARDAVGAAIHLLEDTVEALVPQLNGRGQRIAQVAQVLGTELAFKPRQLAALVGASHLHHIGFMRLSQGTAITKAYLEEDCSYVDLTVDLLSGHAMFADMLDIIRFHRVRLDKTGHPADIKTGDWKVESQVLALAVMLDLKANLPLLFNIEDTPLREIIEDMLADRKGFVSEPVMAAFENAYKNGLILEG